jgi:hypothetical protein
MKERLELYKRALKYFNEDNRIKDHPIIAGFCWYLIIREDVGIDDMKNTIPELYTRRTINGPYWFNGRHERIKALKSAIWELRRKIWISNVRSMLRLKR